MKKESDVNRDNTNLIHMFMTAGEVLSVYKYVSFMKLLKEDCVRQYFTRHTPINVLQ